MTDCSELKRLAEVLNRAIAQAEHKPGEWAETAQSMGGICCPGEPFQIGKPWAKEEPWASFSYKRDSWLAVAAVNALPELLELIAENESLRGSCKAMGADMGKLTRERNSFRNQAERAKAENAGLRTGYEAYEQVVRGLRAEIEELRKDKDRIDALESNFWDVRHESHPIADTGDSSSSLEIVGHWMDKPFERVIGEDWNENLRAAIDQAMKAPAYPPARPEYEFDDIPDFGGGSGNKARRRAEAMGIDYDAAMRKEASRG